MKVVSLGKCARGQKVAVRPAVITVPRTSVAGVPVVTVKVVAPSELARITSLNVTLALLLRATSIAPLSGSVETTVGGTTGMVASRGVGASGRFASAGGSD